MMKKYDCITVTQKGTKMNILHCPECGGNIIINTLCTFSFTKRMILTDDGFEELSDRIMDEINNTPTHRLTSAYCENCGKEWRRPFYEIGSNVIDGSKFFIELNQDEVNMTYSRRKKYFLDKGIEI